MKRLFSLLVILAAAAQLVLGCVPAGSRARDLLAQDYTVLSDPELQTYYRQINDQLAAEARMQRRKGEYLHSSAADSETVDQLQARRNSVRMELERRKLLP